MSFVLPLLVISGITSGALFWAAYGLPGSLHLTYHVMDLCLGFFTRCAAYYYAIKVIFLWTGAAILLTGFIYGIIKGTAGIIKAHLSIKKLPLSKRRGQVALIKDAGSKAAFTHGLFRPVIYISTGLLDTLDREELKAVFLHELHHKRRLDPLRFFLLTLLKDSFFYIPLIKYLVGYIRFKKEHEADDAAVASANESLSLALALLKVAAFHRDMAMMPASITGGAEGGAVAVRVRRLVEGKEARFKLPTIKTVAASLFMTVFLTMSLALPLNAAFTGHDACSTKQCAMHAKKPADKKTLCDTPAHRR